MNKFVEKGFTLIEMLVALAIAGALVAIAIPSYKFYVAHAQATESIKAATMQSFNVGQNLQRGRCTTVAGVNDVYPNRFGTLTISGAKVISKGENCPSGCIATFKFNNTTEKNLHGKEVVFNILNNQKVSFVSSTVNSRYLSKDLKTISKTATDNCTAIPNQPLTTTGSTPPGGSSTDPTPTTPTPTTPPPTTPTPTTPTPTTPTPTTPTPTTPTPTTPTPSDPVAGNETKTVIATNKANIRSYWSCQRSCTAFNYMVSTTEQLPASVVVNGKTVEFTGLGFSVGILNMQGIDFEAQSGYGIIPNFKNPSDAALINQYSKVKITVTAPDGTTAGGTLNKLANNVWHDSGYISVMKLKYGSTFEQTNAVWDAVRNLVKNKGTSYSGVGYQLTPASITYEFIK